MTSQDVFYSKGKNDECWTPDYGVKPILKYIPKDAVVWCPFDTADSEFVKQISKTNKVIATHIWGGAGHSFVRTKRALGLHCFQSAFYKQKRYVRAGFTVRKALCSDYEHCMAQ